jgi:RNA polymerase sigma-70 factor (ECF subfamily)
MEAVAVMTAMAGGADERAVEAPVADPEGARLATAAAGGSAEAFRRIVERHQDSVYRLVVRMVRDPALAEDIAQETFLKAYRALPGYDPRWKLSSWLLKIAHNATIDHLRRQRLDTTPLELGPEAETGSPIERLADDSVVDAERQLRGRALARDLQAALATLDPAYRELLLLRFQEGMAYQEIAEVTGLPLGTVKVRLHRGRKRLADLLAARGWKPAGTAETPGSTGS